VTNALLASTLTHLERLVAARTENPPKRIGESGVLEYVAGALPKGFEVELTDLGEGSINLFASRGTPRILWNFHLDTVPAAVDWDGSPFELHVDEDRACAVGLGACDIKGAVAAMLSAVSVTRGDVALLFSTDEEAGKGRCIAAFLERAHAFASAFEGVVVAEPTKGHAVLAHRGIGTASGVFHGHAGHASQANALDDSATHEAVRWATAALAHAERSVTEGTGELAGLRFNLGRIEGGEKPNVVAAETRVRFGVRPPPGTDPRVAVAALQALAPRKDRVAWEPGFFGPPLPADAGDDLLRRGRALAERLDLPIGPPVDFWTEAALFSQRGYPAIVYGPGDIAQAHAKNEWVSLHELADAAAAYERLLTPPN
jgi:acetylornithine deacetylase